MNKESERYRFTRLQEWPFSSETKIMTVQCVPRGLEVSHSVQQK